ncbi:MAG: histone deacetylase [Roseiflexus sp.]|jgi:acetoin utilization deacetylase AcuC-like enzyme|nr:histone deacetylase [Roseiflexus sp.]MBO9366103.1 histone deacetylase [Roseiflexus sp.]MBO9383993.1 histone deacetylase [Roseiflexus sp.]MBO9389177.1 histone deacetylase [Roseiflexus sp.]
MRTAIAINPHHAAHDEPRHVERAARLHAINAALNASDLRSVLLEVPARPATEAQLRAVHTEQMIELVRWTATRPRSWIDHDTYTTSASWDAALMAAGTTLAVVDAVVNGSAQNGFALVRPPGHHATHAESMGFCLFNNVAIAARYAIDHLGITRVAIIDFDVHHGNGTQDIFYDDDRVFFCSTHASPLYPGTGAEREIGSGRGYGTTMNLPLPHGVGDAGFARLFDDVVIPALHRYRPELILVSAGYDAHWADPLGPLTLSVAGYAALTRRLKETAEEVCHGRIVLVLEGGYNLKALAASVLACLGVLANDDTVGDPFGPSNEPEPDISALIARMRQNHPLLAG